MSDSLLCADRVVAVTGAGRGIGRAYALALARAGARVVVNDFGGDPDGRGASQGPADSVVDEIRDVGGEAIAYPEDIAQTEGADGLVARAVEHFGRLDVVINNAGIDRPGMLIDLSDEDWDAVCDVHLRAQFRVLRAAARHWRQRSRSGESVQAALVNTSSPAAIMGFRGEGAYSAAKAGVLALSATAADELAEYGVAVNAVVPGAATRLTEWSGAAPGPETLAPLIVWLSAEASSDVSGQVFSAAGGIFMVMHGWEAGEPVVLGDGSIDDLTSALRDRIARERAPAEVLAPGRNLPPRPGVSVPDRPEQESLSRAPELDFEIVVIDRCLGHAPWASMKSLGHSPTIASQLCVDQLIGTVGPGTSEARTRSSRVVHVGRVPDAEPT